MIFQDIIYTEVKKRENNTDSNMPAKYEIEFIQPSDLVMKFEELMGARKLTEPEKTSLNIVFTSKKHKGNILYQDLHSVMSTLNIMDNKVPKGQSPQQQLDYSSLDNRSIRLVNRMINYLGSEQVSFSDFMKDIV